MQGSIISARRAKAELKQKEKGVRADGMGAYESKVFAVYSISEFGYKFTELFSPSDVDRYNDGAMKFLIADF